MPAPGLLLAILALSFPAQERERNPEKAVATLLAVLCVARIGDWRDSETLVAAGRRVSPKSHRLIWEEAAIAAEKAQSYLLKGDAESARRIAAYAAYGSGRGALRLRTGSVAAPERMTAARGVSHSSGDRTDHAMRRTVQKDTTSI